MNRIETTKVFLTKYFHVILLFAILLGHIYTKLIHPELQLYGDEPYSIFIAQSSLSELLGLLKTDANPPLFFILLHYWIKLFGIGIFAVKSLPILFSIGSAILLFLIGNKYLGKLGTITISIIYLMSNLHFDFSHEIRAFSFVSFLVLCSFYLFLQLLSTPGNKKLLVLYTIVNAAIPFSHYNAVLAIFTQFLALIFLYNKSIKQYLWVLGSYGMSLLLFLPQLATFFNIIPDDTFWLKSPGMVELNYVFHKIVGNDLWFLPIMALYLSTLVMAVFPFRGRFYASTFNVKFMWIFFIGLQFPFF